VSVERLTYAGNHGLEISGPRVERIHEDAEHLHLLMQTVYDAMREAMRPFAGVIVEDKQLGVALHYRLADPQIVSDVINVFYKVLETFNGENLLRATTGKSVLEVRPNIAWDKGKAVLWLLRMIHGANWREDVLPFYLGDDVTDEDAFQALRHKGITILVGPVPPRGTAAQYRLEHTSDVTAFLEWMTQARE
jgi:trehalose-phosphatase